MINAVKMDVEEQTGHLADSEVARLLEVLQNAEFKRSETRNITKDHSFKPRSLMEIAIEAQQRDAEIEAVKQAEEALAAAKRAEAASASKAQGGDDQTLDDPNFASPNSADPSSADPSSADPSSADPDLDNQGSPIGKDDDGALMPADGAEDVRGQTASSDSPPPPIIDAAANVTPDMTPDMGSDDQFQDLSSDPANRALANDGLRNDGRSNDGRSNDATETDPVADHNEGDAAQGAPIAANFETVTAAFERGKAEGIIAGREAGVAETKAAAEASAQANLADKIAAFEAALVALAKPQALQAEDLSRSIHAAILKLASQRAGQQIDDMPEHFLARIEALVTSIGQKMSAGKVHINADDYKVMLPYLADADFDFVAEPGLARGDIILKFAGVELHDIAESRLGGQYAETAKNKAKAPVEAADLAPKPTPAEPTPAEPTPTDGADMSSPVQNADDGSKDTAAFDTAASDTAQDDPSAAPSDEIASDETPS